MFPLILPLIVLTLTVFTLLRNSMREKMEIHSTEIVSEVRQKSSVINRDQCKTKNVKYI